MIETLLLAGLLLPSDTLVFSGRDHQLDVSPPRFEEAGISYIAKNTNGQTCSAATEASSRPRERGAVYTGRCATDTSGSSGGSGGQKG